MVGLGMIGERRWRSAAAALVVAAAAAAMLPSQSHAATVQGPATNVAASAGIAQTTQSIGAFVGDINGDGLPDFLLNRAFKATAREYLNTGGAFVEANAGTFKRNDKHGCAMDDVNHDSRTDIYCTVGASHGTDVKSNELWMQRADGTFVNRAVAYAVDDPYGRSRGAVFFDANNDGWDDLFVSNYYPRTDALPTPNRFFQNQAGTSFSSGPAYGLDQTVGGLAQAPGCQDAADYDGDGYTDLLVCGKTSIHVYHNNGGSSFTDVTASLGPSGVWQDGEWIDFNKDGLLDLAIINHRSLQIRLQQPDGRFNVVSISRSMTEGRALATGDVNMDGWPDLYALQGATGPNQVPNPPDYMYLSGKSGTTLTRVSIPETSAGTGASVTALDYNGDGTTDFLVTNGARSTEGPVQLISFPPPTTTAARGAPSR